MKSRKNKFAPTLSLVLAFAAINLSLATEARAQALTNIVGAPGYTVAGLILDSAGNLYGTSVYGGYGINCTGGCGTVFEVSPPASPGGSWTETVLFSFTKGADGAFPAAGLVFDSKGKLYGTTPEGGAGKGGTVFKLSRGTDGIWKKTVLHNFYGGTGGGGPQLSSLIFDANGNLYGTAMWNNSTNCTPRVVTCGLVFKLSPTSAGGWKETVLHYFSGGTEGAWPDASLTFDTAGNLYGVSSRGGKYAGGVVFKLSPTVSGTWQETVLHAFTGKADGGSPMGPVIFDSAGNLYGAAQGGSTGSVVFKLSPSGHGWKESVLYIFNSNGPNGYPSAGVIFDAAGNLWGTTTYYNSNACWLDGCGQVFQLTPSSSGWTLGAVYSAGRPSYGGLIRDPAGNIYGTDTDARYTAYGSVFEVTK